MHSVAEFQPEDDVRLVAHLARGGLVLAFLAMRVSRGPRRAYSFSAGA